MKKTLFLALFALLSITNVYAQTSTSDLNRLYGGYWMMLTPVGDKYNVINFYEMGGKLMSDNYQFHCQADGKYQQIDTVISQLSNSEKGLGLIESGSDKPYAHLNVLHINDGILLLNQSFSEISAMSESFPDGLTFAYKHTTELKPICSNN